MLNLTTQLWLLWNHEKAQFLQRFFKTWPWEYAEKDKFLWVIVPQVRKVAKAYLKEIKNTESIPWSELENYLHSPRHEVRLATLLIFVELFKTHQLSPLIRGEGTKPKAEWKRGLIKKNSSNKDSSATPQNDKMRENSEQIRDKIVSICLANTAYINNRDLVDVTMPSIIWAYYFDKDCSDLHNLAKSNLLRDRRISIVSTFYFIKQGQHTDTFQIAEILLHDQHDLIHKATGWMLREVWKRIDENLLKNFLDIYAHQMPRTMLRYTIEKLPEETRLYYLKKQDIKNWTKNLKISWN